MLFFAVCSGKQHGQDVDYDYTDIEDLENPGNVQEEEGSRMTEELPQFNQRSKEITVKEGETLKLDCRIRKPSKLQFIFYSQVKRE